MKSDIFKTNGAVATISEPMEAETISKTGKSQTRGWNFLSFLVVAAIAVSAVFTSCDKKDDEDDNGKIKLLETITFDFNEYGESLLRFEYDEQNRITRVAWYDENERLHYTLTFTYTGKDLTRLVEAAPGYSGTTYDFTRSGNTITAADSDYRHTFTLNSAGYLTRLVMAYEEEYGEQICEFSYDNAGNLVKISSLDEYEDETGWSYDFKHDTRNSPFRNDKTPKWIFPFMFLIDDWYEVGLHNNPTEITFGGSYKTVATYVYDSDNFPTKATWKGKEDDGDEYEYVITFTYIEK